MIYILQEKSIINSISKSWDLAIKPLKRIKTILFDNEIGTTGNSPIKILGNDYESYAAKNSKSKQPPTDIINEVLAHYFLKIWNIPTPEIALITIDPNSLPSKYSSNHKKHYYDFDVFGSQWIQAIESNDFIKINNKKDFDSFNNLEKLFNIGLFDIWVANDDRKPTNHNLLLQTINGKQNIVAIDHAFIFESRSYANLDADMFCPVENDNIFVSEFAKSLKRYILNEKPKFEVINREIFYAYVGDCQQYFADIVKNIPKNWNFTKEHQTKLYNFLFNMDRNKKVFDEFQYKISI